MTAPLLETVAELERLEREATPAPWPPAGLGEGERCSAKYHEFARPGDCALTIAARNAAPRLCAALREAVDIMRSFVEFEEGTYGPCNPPCTEEEGMCAFCAARAFLARMGVET